MDKDTARAIIERYAKALADTNHLVGGAPVSKLPCEPELIKEAIRLYFYEVPVGSDTYHKLRMFYVKLASFIPDDQAERSAKAESAMMSMDPTDEGFAYLDEHGEILRRIQNQTSVLQEELQAYLENISR